MEQEKNNLQEQMLETDFNREVYIDESFPKQDQLSQKFLIDLLTFDHFVLLGDPGIGKTFSFQNAAKYENAIYQTVEAFRITRGKDCKEKVLQNMRVRSFIVRTKKDLTLRMYSKNVLIKLVAPDTRFHRYFTGRPI